MSDKFNQALNNPSICEVLKKILDSLDKKPFSKRTNNIFIEINEKNFLELYEPSEDSNDRYLEKDIKYLVTSELFLFSNKSKDYLPLSQRKVKLIFNKTFEDKIRVFYNREISEYTWENALLKFNFDEQLMKILKTTPLLISSKTHVEVLEKFELWLKSNKKSSSIRQESSRCFWGLSKIFDKKTELCNYLELKEKPIILQVHKKDQNSKKILFIENQETFISCMESSNKIFNDFILIYSSGYKASASRIRQKNGSKIFFDNFDLKLKEEFLLWFYSENNTKKDVYFWGDLDYSGISILTSLKKNFTNLLAWEEGYSLMVKELEDNRGHYFEMAGKEKQKEINISECKYSNEVLIPLINKTKMFLDQEFVSLDLIKSLKV